MKARITEGGDNGRSRVLRRVAAFERGAMREASPADICAIYKQYKPILEKLIPLIRELPLIGKGVAAALETLKSALDVYCPAAEPLREARARTDAFGYGVSQRAEPLRLEPP